MRRVLAIGLSLEGDGVSTTGYRSNTSTGDFDVIVIRPHLREFKSTHTNSAGHRYLGSVEALQVLEHAKRWQRELRQALDQGKTVVVVLPAAEVVQLRDPEEDENVYESNYDCLPMQPARSPHDGAGKLAVLTSAARAIASAWRAVADHVAYEVCFDVDDFNGTPWILTKDGARAIRAARSRRRVSAAPDARSPRRPARRQASE